MGVLQFSNLLGSVYSQGNILFTPVVTSSDGGNVESVLSPVGNRLSIFDLVKYVLAFLDASRCNKII